MHTELWKAADDGAIELNVHAQPGAGRTHIAGRHGTALKVRVAAPPEQGRSNEALVKALAEAFGVAERDVELVSGEKSRIKRFRLRGLEVEDFEERLERLVAEEPAGPASGRRGSPPGGKVKRR
jgi:uncharacterized protein (TIGR00251 family)